MSDPAATLRSLLNGTTPGPWLRTHVIRMPSQWFDAVGDADARLAAAAPTLAKALLDVLAPNTSACACVCLTHPHLCTYHSVVVPGITAALAGLDQERLATKGKIRAATAARGAQKTLERARREQARVSEVLTESRSVSGEAIPVLRRAGYLRGRCPWPGWTNRRERNE